MVEIEGTEKKNKKKVNMTLRKTKILLKTFYQDIMRKPAMRKITGNSFDQTERERERES